MTDTKCYCWYLGEVELASAKMSGGKWRIYHNASMVESIQFRDTLDECDEFVKHLVPEPCREHIKRMIFGEK